MMKTLAAAAQMRRREFIKTSAGLTAFAAAGPLADLATAAAEPPSDGKTIGIQVGAVSFVDEGTDKVLADSGFGSGRRRRG